MSFMSDKRHDVNKPLSIIYPDYYGFPGHPVTLPCVVFDQPENTTFATLEWQMNPVIVGQTWFRVVMLVWIDLQLQQPIYPKERSDRNVSVSVDTGALTIHDFRKHDEGLYRCSVIEKNPAFVELQQFGGYHFADLDC